MMREKKNTEANREEPICFCLVYLFFRSFARSLLIPVRHNKYMLLAIDSQLRYPNPLRRPVDRANTAQGLDVELLTNFRLFLSSPPASIADHATDLFSFIEFSQRQQRFR